ncbi:MAG: GH3 auxin-responsive promoter family protein [Myxococcaceae bacterium]|nr:GH3 auxin-responsive promoter family protein [Myxococcaceae bacterium]
MPRLKPALMHVAAQLQRLPAATSFGLAVHQPERTQRRRLREILERTSNTRFGRAHGLEPGLTPEQYAQRVPLMSAAELAPWVASEMSGESAVLTVEKPVYYVRTTGSTGAPKHVPITPSYRAEFQKTVQVALFHLFLKFPDAFTSTALYFVGSRRVAKAADGCDVGTMSGFAFTEMPPVVRSLYAWPYELFEVKDLKTRTYLALWLATVGDISIVAGIFPAPIVYLLRDLAELAPQLAKSARDGRLPGWLQLDDAQRAFFSQRLQPNATAGRRLERAAAASLEEKAVEAWPSLRLVYCWVTATAALYVPELQRRLPHVAIRDAIYSACEGWASIPMGDDAPGGALAIESVWFEFIEETAYLNGRRETVPAWGLEDKQRYLIVMSTGAGLHRYVLGDIVEVCGFHHHTPRIRFVRKLGAASNLAGEKLEEEHVNRAVGDALAELQIAATFFTLAPRLGRERPAYALYFEPMGQPGSDRLEALRAKVDENLAAASFDYGRLRAGNQLTPLELELLTPGSYDRVRQARVGEGSAEAQLKTAHLVADPASLPF